MPEHGYYEKRPRQEHRDFLTRYLRQRRIVDNVEVLDDFRLVVTRRGLSEIRIYLTNQYTLGIADVMDIIEADPATDCIVSTMSYNQFTIDAKDYALNQGVGLFHAKDFLGAVNYEGDSFTHYVPRSLR